ncbi:CPBP family intramembrane glutamic endopeptidase [Emticicia sp. BO119]|uniref:CPBP family intramembrane glutamic endopeptidase n=1 Tax=Emticicia sp. BO119 TaxID=2757768 RepID=UPI0015EFF516|nr:CPBP family intramembrane glutamic endopeptidase [Emticicia sp. BO119]MBA4848795.1 CPBP family intramembrane metalloprotease [Emticicia sp. BO119]
MKNNSTMYFTSKENAAAPSILILLGLFLVNFIVAGTILQFGVMTAFGGSFEDIMKVSGGDYQHFPNAWLSMVLGQGLGSFVGFIGTSWFYWRIIEKKQWSGLNFRPLPNIRIFLMIILIEVVFMGFNGWLQELNQNFVFPESMKGLETVLKSMEEQLAKATRFFTTFTSFWQFILAFIVIAVIAGVGEELLFRGLLMRKLLLGTKNIHVAIWLAGFIFAFIHFQFYGILPRMMLGVLFGYLYYWTGNIWVPIIAHIFNNGLAIVVMYLYNLGIVKTDLESIDHVPMPIVLFSLVATIGLLFLFRNYVESKTIESQS